MYRKTLLLAACAALGLAPQARAHNAWLLPSITVLSDTNQSVTVDAGASTAPFEPDHNPLNIDGVRVWAPDGTMGKIENPAKGRYRATFDVRIDKPGTWRVGLENSGITGTFKVNGENWAISRRRGGGPGAPGGAGGPSPQMPAGPGRPAIDPGHMVANVDEIPAGATDLDLTEMQNRNEFFVTAGTPSEAVLRPSNKGLEFVPVTLPTDLVSNEPGKFRFLVDGKPAAGLKVEVIPGGRRFREADRSQELTTDADGMVTVNWPVPGFYWLSTSHTDDRPSDARARKRRMSYAATLEVVAP